MLNVSIKKINFYFFIILLIFMPMHYLIFSCLLKNYKILSLWRDVIIVLLAITATKGKIRNKIPDITIIAIILTVLLYAILGLSRTSINTARTYCVPLLIYFYMRSTSFSEKEKKLVIWINWCLGVMIAAWGLIQAFVLGPDILINIGYGGSNGVFDSAAFYINTWSQQRVVGTFSSPNGCGAYFAILIIFLVNNFHKIKSAKGLFRCGIGLIALGLVATFSRSAWIGCVLGLIVFNKFQILYVKKKTIYYILLLIIVALTLFSLLGNLSVLVKIFSMFTSHLGRTVSGEDASFLRHLQELYEPMAIVVSNPLGLGFGSNGPIALSHLPLDQTHQVESSVWTIAYEIGFLGMILYFTPYVYGVVKCIRYKHDNMARCTMKTLICILVVFIVLPSVQAYEQPFYAMLFLGCVQKCLEEKKCKKQCGLVYTV